MVLGIRLRVRNGGGFEARIFGFRGQTLTLSLGELKETVWENGQSAGLKKEERRTKEGCWMGDETVYEHTTKGDRDFLIEVAHAYWMGRKDMQMFGTAVRATTSFPDQ